MTPREAMEIVADTRDIFNLKSTNKLYSKARNRPERMDWDAIDKDVDSMGRKEFRLTDDNDQKRELQKAIKRYNQLVTSKVGKERDKNVYFPTAYQRGQSIFDRRDDIAGNCSEQSDVAAYLAIGLDRSIRDLTYIAELSNPGDHVFCVILRRSDPPSWRNVAEMIGGCTDALAFILDPWMNLSCYAASYRGMASAKMNKWLGQGKRIDWAGKDGKTGGWYQPGGDYLESFLYSPLKYEKAI